MCYGNPKELEVVCSKKKLPAKTSGGCSSSEIHKTSSSNKNQKLPIKCSNSYPKVFATISKAKVLSKNTMGSHYIAKELEAASSANGKQDQNEECNCTTIFCEIILAKKEVSKVKTCSNDNTTKLADVDGKYGKPKNDSSDENSIVCAHDYSEEKISSSSSGNGSSSYYSKPVSQMDCDSRKKAADKMHSEGSIVSSDFHHLEKVPQIEKCGCDNSSSLEGEGSQAKAIATNKADLFGGIGSKSNSAFYERIYDAIEVQTYNKSSNMYTGKCILVSYFKRLGFGRQAITKLHIFINFYSLIGEDTSNDKLKKRGANE